MSRYASHRWRPTPPSPTAPAAVVQATCIFALVVCAAAGAASATEPLPTPPIYSAPHVDPRAEPGLDLREGTAASPYGSARAVVPAIPDNADRRPSPLLPARRSSATLIEMPADYRPAGGYVRPHHAIGFRSTAAENWLREQGIEARLCYVPMLRARARVTPSGDASAAFWVYARCSIR